jgi:glucose/arabinose dehydrogenase/PKD repeat protein
LSRRFLARLGALVTAVFVLGGAEAAAAPTFPSGFETVTLTSGLTAPTAVTWAPDGRMFIAEKQGRVKVLNPNSTSATTILDISDHVNNWVDRGLLGLAADSSFASNGYLYLLYVHDHDPLHPAKSKSSRLTRVTVRSDNTVVNPTSPETVVVGSVVGAGCPAPSNTVDCIPADQALHTIGTVRSDPDGTLWLGSGDTTTTSVQQVAFRTYDERSLAGKIMHVDRNGRGLPGHPFCPTDADLTHVCTKVYAKGFRNPFRFTLRTGGKGPVVGDVGARAREEVDLLQAGKNYGWPCYEGTVRTPGYDATPECAAEYAKEGTAQAAAAPIYDYPVGGSGAVVAGPTYTATAYPPEYRGDIFVGDYAQGFIRRLKLTAGDQLASVPGFATNLFGFVDLELAPNGNLTYVLFGDGSAGTGEVRQLRFASSNRSPVASASASPEYGAAPLTVQFTGSGSSDPDGDALTYDWDFGDGTAHSSAANPAHTYTDGTRNFTAKLTVSDGKGGSDAATVTISPGNTPPSATITAPADESTFRAGQPVTLTGQGTDAGNPLPGSSLRWHVILHHSTHTHDLGNFTGASAGFTALADHDSDSFYEIELTATDSRGLSDSDTATIRPETRSFTLQSSPSGAPVTYAGTPHTAPFTHQAAIGFQASISAADRFTQGGKSYEFVSWSDGGARVHTVTIPAANTTLTATYREAPAGAYRDAVLGTAGLRSYWRLGEAFGTTAADEKGANPGSYGGGVTLGRPGALSGDPNTAAGFDGVNDEMSAGGPAVGAQATLEGWFDWEAGVATMRDSTGTGGVGWILAYDSAGKLAYRAAGLSIVTVRSTATIRDGWHHFALTKSGSSAALYVDGVLVHNATGFGSAAATMPWRVMRNGTAAQFSRGDADEVAVYDRALTAAEVAQHHQAGVGGGGGDPAPAAPSGLTATPGDRTVTLDWADNTEADLAGYDVYRSTTAGGGYIKVNAQRLTTSSYANTGLTNGTTYYYVVRAVDTGGQESANSGEVSATPVAPPQSSYRSLVMGTAGLRSYWRLGEAFGTTAADEKGANPGTFLGGPTLGQPGALSGDSNTAARFDGVNDEMSAGGPAAGANGTLEGWFYWEAGVATMRDSTGTGGVGWILAYDSAGKLAYRAAGKSIVTTRGTATVRNGWHHFALTKSGPSAALYVDGALVHNATGFGSTAAAMPWRAMRNGTAAQFSRGRADELAVYDRALTAAEVQQHHQAG